MEEQNSKENEIISTPSIEEVEGVLADRIRKDSKDSSSLTGAGSLLDLYPDQESEYIDSILRDMVGKDDYPDINLVISPDGAAFYYSTSYITKEYAQILGRVESSDMGATIAMTVRDDSRIYPRLTKLGFFKVPPFNIPEEEIEPLARKTMSDDKYRDIKLITASTGQKYLYSDLYINDYYASTLAEWEEVGQFENP